jgi:Holliday junction resolvase RusA-like endonuclease
MYTGRDGYAHRGKKLTKEAKAYKEAVCIFAKGLTVSPLTDAERRRVEYHVEVTVYLARRQRLDSDNTFKVAIDALAFAGVLRSDAFVLESKAIIVKNQRDNPRTHYIVERIDKHA